MARDVEAPLRAIDEADLHLALLTTPGVEAHRLLPALWPGAERALAARLRRNAQTFTEYDGVISLGDEQVAPEHWSASALQRYATCPYRYFLGNVLRLNAVSEPGDDAEISPLERGSLIHRILERWVRGWLEQPDQKPWRNYVADADALHAVADEELAQAEQDQALGLPASAKATREKVLRDLERYRRMQAADAAVGWSPLAVEREFSGVSLPIGGGDSISARGRIDRIDENSGDRLRAIDYKTGKRRGERSAGPLQRLRAAAAALHACPGPRCRATRQDGRLRRGAALRHRPRAFRSRHDPGRRLRPQHLRAPRRRHRGRPARPHPQHDQ